MFNHCIFLFNSPNDRLYNACKINICCWTCSGHVYDDFFICFDFDKLDVCLCRKLKRTTQARASFHVGKNYTCCRWASKTLVGTSMEESLWNWVSSHVLFLNSHVKRYYLGWCTGFGPPPFMGKWLLPCVVTCCHENTTGGWHGRIARKPRPAASTGAAWLSLSENSYPDKLSNTL